MSRPDARRTRYVAGHPVTLMIAAADGPAAARVRPLTGEDELKLSDVDVRRTAPALREADLLDLAVVDIGGVAPTPERLDALTLGDRTRLMLAVLVASYGAPVELLLSCGSEGCDETYELPLDVRAILEGASVAPDSFAFQVGDAEVSVTLPTGADMIALAKTATTTSAALFARCAPGSTPDMWEGIENEMARRDPFAEVYFATTCDACGAEVRGLLDPLVLVNNEMRSYGNVMVEIDRLARSYGWSDAQLGAMTAHRRRLYLAALAATDLDVAGALS